MAFIAPHINALHCMIYPMGTASMDTHRALEALEKEKTEKLILLETELHV